MRDDWKNWEIHPIAYMMPSMTEVEYQRLKASIAKRGLDDSIVKYEGKILDGRHRFKACVELDKKPDHVNLPASVDPVAFVIAKNWDRRHLAPSQTAQIIVSMKAAEKAQAKRKGSKADWDKLLPGDWPGSSGAKLHTRLKLTATETKQLAKAASVGTRTIRQAQKVHNEGIPEVAQAVTEKKVKLGRAVEVADLPREEQPAALAQAIADTGTRKKPEPEPKPITCPCGGVCPCHKT